ncbi:hypothetical protein OEZ86_010046 [Tetradesmus obliquus]|uniref:Uncharacterized protein n=1 Tax=Tetradesmus obliquus TaxID=3088 RepID=A0ABY8UUC8_TETOB|nr:hypothetical protein OEZ85_001481 [Tetradesmus obliquus]WIA43600.1 hypothetical protein OEZ86_010046 [Tetradesmus obliquus]
MEHFRATVHTLSVQLVQFDACQQAAAQAEPLHILRSTILQHNRVIIEIYGCSRALHLVTSLQLTNAETGEPLLEPDIQRIARAVAAAAAAALDQDEAADGQGGVSARMLCELPVRPADLGAACTLVRATLCRGSDEQQHHAASSSSPGQLLFREGGPVLKALEQLILLVRAGKLSDPLPVGQMYHNDFAEVPGKLTVPRSKRTTSQLEGYHGAALNHVVRGYNTSAELAIPQLTLTNHAWNIDRLVVAGKMRQYHCYDLALLQLLSNKLQRLGCEPLPDVGEDLLPFLVNDTVNVSALRSAMQDMSCVQVEPGVLPETQQQAEQLEDDMPEGEDDQAATAQLRRLMLLQADMAGALQQLQLPTAQLQCSGQPP